MDKKRPNLLFIFSDQHRKFDLGCYGNDEVMTPNLDKLASEGSRFEHCCSNSPVCVPARGSLLTGLYAQHHGAYTNDMEVRYDCESIADVLNRAGYHTGYIGKWHLCGIPRDQFIDSSRRLGFTEWKVANCNHNYLSCYYDDEQNVRHQVPGYEPEIFGSLAAEFLERNSENEEPFALFLSFAAPHEPHTIIGEEYKEMYRSSKVTLRENVREPIVVNKRITRTIEEEIEQARGYYGHITAIDRQVGQLMKILEEKNIRDNTLVVYTSDHGEMLGSQGVVDKQLPFEESMGVPLILSKKDQIPVAVKENMIGLVDLPETILGLLRLSFESETDGRDLHRMVESCAPDTGEDDEECYLYDLFPCHQAYDKGFDAWRGLRTRRWTFAARDTGADWLLFDNEQDPYQMHNLVDDPAYAEVRAELKKRLTAYVEKNDGYMDGFSYVRFSHTEKEFNKSQHYFKLPLLCELEKIEKDRPHYSF